MVQVLSCRCGDCLHWEIFKKPLAVSLDVVLKCKTCEEEFPVSLAIPPADKLEWVEHAAA